MVIVVFTITLRPDIPVDEYERTGTRMTEIVSTIPGFLGMDYSASDGHEMLVARFESHDSLKAWREHPEHQEAQRQGRERFFAHYRIEVCDEARFYEYDAETGYIEPPGAQPVT
jgi:heme-degrading monooxygenase HmoA